eukprot:c35536_g1_i1 orf=497-901(+)
MDKDCRATDQQQTNTHQTTHSQEILILATIDRIATRINNQIHVMNWARTQQTMLQMLSKILLKGGWWGTNDSPAETTTILRQVLQYCEDQKVWQRTRQGTNGEGKAQQTTIVDWLIGEAKKKARQPPEDKEVNL